MKPKKNTSVSFLLDTHTRLIKTQPKQLQEPTMNYAIAGGAIVGAAQLDESLLDTITRRLRTGWRRLILAHSHKDKS